VHVCIKFPLFLVTACLQCFDAVGWAAERASGIQIGFTFLVPAHPGSPGKRAVKRVCVCVCVCF